MIDTVLIFMATMALLMEGNMTASQKASQKAAIKLIHSCGKPR
jgi:hypothetical protein